MNEWKYNNPVFECDQYNAPMLAASPWAGHRLFIYDFIAWLTPKRIVELGSFYGCSAFAMLQAIKDFKLDTEFYGIDLWKRFDLYTYDDYREDIYNKYKEINDKCFSEQKSFMIRESFDEAAEKFKEESIDLLHIDGSHEYEAVEHDFMTWIEKVDKRGIILFHDINEGIISGKILGSHYFWEHIKKQYECYYEFEYSFGLGILFLDKNIYHDFLNIIDVKYYQNKNNSLSEEYGDIIRKNYFLLRDKEQYIKDLGFQIEIKEDQLFRYKENLMEKENYIKYLEKEMEDFQLLKTYVKAKELYIEELQEEKKKICEFLDSKERYIEELEYQKEHILQGLEQKNSYIKELQDQKRILNQSIEEKNQYIEEIEIHKKMLSRSLSEKEDYISELKKHKTILNKGLAEKNNYISELETHKNMLNRSIMEKEDYIGELKKHKSQLQQSIEEKNNYIEELESHKVILNEFANSKEYYISELERRNKQLENEILDIKAQNEIQMNDLCQKIGECKTWINYFEKQMEIDFIRRHFLKRIREGYVCWGGQDGKCDSE